MKDLTSEKTRVSVSAISALLLAWCMATTARAVDGTWTSDAAANWSDTTRWLDGVVADGVDGLANFATIPFTANRTITLDTSRTIGAIRFSDTDTTSPTGTGNTVTMGGANTLTLETTTGAPTITTGFGDSNIKNQILIMNTRLAGTQGFIKEGLGDLRIGVTNSGLSGNIIVNSGSLRLEAGAATNGLGSTAVTINNTGTLYLNNAAVVVNNNVTISGLGALETDGVNNYGAIRFAANGSTLNGTVTLAADSRIGSRGAGAAGGNMNGQITGDFALEFGHVLSSGVINLANIANNWGGDTRILSGTVRLMNSEVIPHGPGAGNVIIGDPADAAVDAVLDLNGRNETINGLGSTGNLARDIVQNNAATTTSTLTLGANNASGSFGGILRNNSGTGGTLALSKTGDGTQVLSGANTYTGATAIDGGSLLINGSLANSIVSINSGGTLGGSGSVGGNTVLMGGGRLSPGAAANSAGTLTFSGTASLDLTLGVTAVNSQALIFDLASLVGSDRVVLNSGPLTIGTGLLEWDDFVFNDLGIEAGTYVLFSSATPIVGTLGLNTTGTIGSEWIGSLDFANSGMDLVLQVAVVPEPATGLLLTLGAILFLGWRRKASR